jgi:hypothetical protein
LEYQHPPFAVADLQKNGQSLTDYGLDQPALTLTFTAGTATPPATFSLRIGTTTALDNQLYILSPDSTHVGVVDRSLINTLSLDSDQLYSKAIFTIQLFEARELSLQGATAARIRLHRDGARWSFDSPLVTRADKAATERDIVNLNSLTWVQFLNPQEAPPELTGLLSPVLRVTLQGNNREETLLVGKSAPATLGRQSLHYARLEDERTPVFLVDFPATLLADLDRAQETLRDHRVLDFDPAAVTAITLAAPGQPSLLLQRLEAPAGSTAAWQISRPGGTPPLPADHDLVQFLLDRLSLLTAKSFASDAPTPADLEKWGFNRPEREVNLTLTTALADPTDPATPASTTTISLQVAHTNTNDFARVDRGRGWETFIYAVPPETLNDLPVAARVYRDRTVRELPTGAQITGLALTVNGGDAAPIYSHQLAAGENWTTALKDETPERQKALAAMLEGDGGANAPKPALLRRLRARQFVTDEYRDMVISDGQLRPWKYRLDLTIALNGGVAGAKTITSTLWLAERSGGGTQLAASPKSESDVVFQLEQPLVDALFTLTNDARDPGPKAPAPTTTPPNPAAK